ncbi:lipoprotein [Spiroplasma apis]|uniref:Lipoprotein n=1 Tax=Spiroplasma apis B31 TaxID=1276258 RepID=V5RIL0_SPIAP|nr:lipoprotein [Spiroplasma apis]AHB36497.1 hypothetical protein SAPIS_v1c06520 [Spiroplasma apis B31]
MKKILGILGAMGMVATTGATVISCGTKVSKETSETEKNMLAKIEEAVKDKTFKNNDEAIKAVKDAATSVNNVTANDADPAANGKILFVEASVVTKTIKVKYKYSISDSKDKDKYIWSSKEETKSFNVKITE